MKKKILFFALTVFTLFSCSKDNVIDTPVNEGKVEIKTIVMNGGSVSTRASSAGGSTNGAGLYNEGADVTVTATPNAGYELDQFSSSDGKYRGSNSYQLKAYPVTFTAKFRKVYKTNYSIRVKNPECGTVSMSTVQFDDPREIETGVTIKVSPKPGYKAIFWMAYLPDGISRLDQDFPNGMVSAEGNLTIDDNSWSNAIGDGMRTEGFPPEWLNNTYFPDGTIFEISFTQDTGGSTEGDTYAAVTIKADCWFNNSWWGVAYTNYSMPYYKVYFDGGQPSDQTTSVTKYFKIGSTCKIFAFSGYNSGEEGYSFSGFYPYDRSTCYKSAVGDTGEGNYEFTVTGNTTIYASFSYIRGEEWGKR